MPYTYIVECKDGTYYTGWTVDLEARVKMHNEGKGAKYTRNKRPVKLIYWELKEDRSQAQKRERAIQKMNKSAKVQLVQQMSK
ncbi:Excinuclease ABC, C subunit domain protein [Alkaliphilus metalliredigens QYMF]|uniref:Excinuclease ABC, C subunit domain protein n=1 Tax=Alkaliphilus metalliredigens (strain QYMF) TaxID=293826 RepID=A6TNR5_ALKMQ|nr:GIY-YIG nuclease family protein [Alkaliphilus metalliredigens]ABR47833.1 Excinuclease ABC, C subunit domain protein [Alkaliphilus metalliredigens QYMF]